LIEDLAYDPQTVKSTICVKLERMMLTFVDSRVNVRLIGSFPNEADHPGFERLGFHQSHPAPGYALGGGEYGHDARAIDQLSSTSA
jgi:hypothetical protein